MKKILIRFDDLNPFMNINILREIEEVCKRYRNSVLLCIVPFCKDKTIIDGDDLGEVFWESIRYCQEQNSVIGLHGFSHVLSENLTKQLFPISKKTEFCGINRNKQYEMIKKGKDFLEQKGLMVRFFAAPAHSMDRNTIKVLRDLKINVVSDSFYPSCTIWKGISWIPLKTWKPTTPFIGSLSTVCIHPKNTINKYKFNDEIYKNYVIGKFDNEISLAKKSNIYTNSVHIIYFIIFYIYRSIKTIKKRIYKDLRN